MSIITVNQQLPSTIEDLAKFVLIGRDRMAAVRAEIRAIDKLGLASTVYKQKLQEGQASFYVIKWDDFKAEGYPFKELSA